MDKYKLIDKYLAEGLTWGEMLDKGITDTDRKKYYGYVDGLNERSDNLLAQEKQKVRILKKELSIERQINNEQIKYLTEHKMITDARKETKQVNHVLNGHIEHISMLKSWYLYALGDFHYNGDVSTLSVLSSVRNEMIRHIKENKLKEIIVVELGDVIEGATLRTSQLMAIKSGMVQQTIEVAHAYKQMLEEVISATNVELTMYSVTSSNHTQLRNLGTKRNELPDEDMMLVFNDILKQTKGIFKFVEGDEIVSKINGYNFYFSHGHTVKNKEGHIQKIGARLGEVIDFGLFGHYHHLRSTDLHKRSNNERLYDSRVFYNPSLAKQETQYEKDLNVSSCAGFGIYEFNNKHGNIGVKKVII